MLFRSCQVQVGGGRGSAGQDEGIERREFLVHAVDFGLQPVDLRLGNAQSTLQPRTAQIRPQVEQIVLNARQHRILDCLGRTHATASEALDALIRGLGMPRTLAEVGVGEDQFQKVAEYTMLDIWGRTNPRPVSSPADIMEILRKAA